MKARKAKNQETTIEEESEKSTMGSRIKLEI